MRALQGLAAAAFAPAVIAYVAEMYPAENRIKTIGYISTGFLAAGIVGQVFSSLIIQSLGWVYVFYFLGGLYLLCAVLLGGFVPKGEHHISAKKLTFSSQLWIIFSMKPLLFCYFITLTLLLSFVGMYTTLGNFLSHDHLS